MKTISIILIFILGFAFSNNTGNLIGSPTQVSRIMRNAVTNIDIEEISKIVSPYYGLAVNRVEFSEKLGILYEPSLSYLYLHVQPSTEYGVTYFMGRPILNKQQITQICEKYKQHIPTENYSREELGVIEIILGWLEGHNDITSLSKPILEKYKKNKYFYEDTKPQLIKQRQYITGQQKVTIDPNEEYYEFGYGHLNEGGDMTFQFHTDKNGNLWLWAIQ